LARADLIVKVFFSDLRQKVVQFVSHGANRLNDKSIPLNRYVDSRTFFDTRFFGE